MKICLLSPLPPPAGGIATWTKIFLEHDLSNINDVYLVNTSAIGKRTYKDTKNIFSEIKRFSNIYKKLKKTLKDCDVMHINVSCSKIGIIKDYLCIKKAYKKGVKTLVQFHCNIADQVVSNFQRKILKKIINITNKLVVINNTSKKYLMDHYNVESILIPNFIKLNNEKNNHSYNDLKNILFVGNVTETKGVNLIVQVAKKFKNLNFILVGKVCDDFDVTNISSNVQIVGMVEKQEVFKYLQKSDVFLFPSYTEGFPLSILEAMNAGLPCITSKVGAIPDVFENGGAILIDLTVDEIVYAINSIYDKSIRKYMGQYNFENVLENYSSNVVIKKIYDEYFNLIKEDEHD